MAKFFRRESKYVVRAQQTDISIGPYHPPARELGHVTARMSNGQTVRFVHRQQGLAHH